MAQPEATRVRLTFITKKLGISTHELVQRLHKAGIVKGVSGYLVEGEEEIAWLVVAKMALEVALIENTVPCGYCQGGNDPEVMCDACDRKMVSDSKCYCCEHGSNRNNVCYECLHPVNE